MAAVLRHDAGAAREQQEAELHKRLYGQGVLPARLPRRARPPRAHQGGRARRDERRRRPARLPDLVPRAGGRARRDAA
eukprot:3694738-Prymnesium_polylepis.1